MPYQPSKYIVGSLLQPFRLKPSAVIRVISKYRPTIAPVRISDPLHLKLKDRMKKNLQLQEWLVQKEQHEMEMLAIESAKRRATERDRQRKNEEFRRRAARQKAKLKRYDSEYWTQTRRLRCIVVQLSG